MKRKFGLLAIVAAGLFSTNALASPSGTFTTFGTLTVSNTATSWSGDAIVAGPTGDYSGLGGHPVTLQGLNNALEPVGASFPAQPFLNFDTGPSLATLLVNFIPGGVYPSSDCGTLLAVVGQVCTPSGSAFSFSNNPPPAPIGPQATLTFVLQGTTSDGNATWIGNFTSQFTTPYQNILAVLAASGSFSNTYSANFVVTPNAVTAPPTGVPEPASLAYLLAALGGLVFLQRGLARRKAAA